VWCFEANEIIRFSFHNTSKAVFDLDLAIAWRRSALPDQYLVLAAQLQAVALAREEWPLFAFGLEIVLQELAPTRPVFQVVPPRHG
jgi:hypothetical protein